MKELLDKVAAYNDDNTISSLMPNCHTWFGAEINSVDKKSPCRLSIPIDSYGCFGSMIKQRFITADITYKIYFTEYTRYVKNCSTPSTLFSKKQIGDFLEYFQNIVDFKFSLRKGYIRNIIRKRDAKYLWWMMKDIYCNDFDKIQLFELTVQINDIRPVHAMILQWVRHIYEPRSNMYAIMAYDLKSLPKLSNQTLFTLLSYLYCVSNGESTSSDMTLFPTTLFEGAITIDKLKDRIARMREVFLPFLNFDIYNSSIKQYKKPIPKELGFYNNRAFFIDRFWTNSLSRIPFIPVFKKDSSIDGCVGLLMRTGRSIQFKEFIKRYDDNLKRVANKICNSLNSENELEEDVKRRNEEELSFIQDLFNYISKTQKKQ